MDYLTEKDLQNSIINYLNIKGHFVWRNNSGVSKSVYVTKSGLSKSRMWRAGIKGGSDIIGVSKNGKFIAIECKIGKNKPTELQTMFLDDVNKRGGIAILAYKFEDVSENENL